MPFKLIYLLLLTILWSCTSRSESLKKIRFRNTNICTEGRIEKTDTSLNMYWSASSITIKFYGSELQVKLSDLTGRNDFEVIIDQDSSYHLDLKKGKHDYQLTKLPLDTHTVCLFKRTEYDRGPTSFYHFKLDPNATVLKALKKEKSIVFYGNSITAGYSIDDYSGSDSPNGTHTNCYPGYAYQTAKHFDAGYKLICKSGIGVMVSWFPYIMDDIYDKVNPIDQKSIHEFNDDKNVVVINLGQNDKWLTKKTSHTEYKRHFAKEEPTDSLIIARYKQFVSKIRTKYPNSNIICALGSMDATSRNSQWPSFVRTAVDQLNDSKIYTFNFTHTAFNGHPKLEQHKQMSEELIGFIEQKKLFD